eukprot:4964869-Pleurochrysis_carterae.AAC.1
MTHEAAIFCRAHQGPASRHAHMVGKRALDCSARAQKGAAPVRTAHGKALRNAKTRKGIESTARVCNRVPVHQVVVLRAQERLRAAESMQIQHEQQASRTRGARTLSSHRLRAAITPPCSSVLYNHLQLPSARTTLKAICCLEQSVRAPRLCGMREALTAVLPLLKYASPHSNRKFSYISALASSAPTRPVTHALGRRKSSAQADAPGLHRSQATQLRQAAVQASTLA